jgi:drug/metabolite transporter (DMT)-like permease
VPEAQPPLLRAVALMVFAAALFGAMSLTVRLATHSMHAFEVAFLRNLFGLAFALPLLWRSGARVMRTERISLYFFRSVIGLVATLASVWAIAHLPLAQAVALNYSTPVFSTVAAALVLGEVVRIRRWSAVLVGFAGVVVVMHPEDGALSFGALVAVLSAVLNAGVAVSIKVLSRTESSGSIVLNTLLIWTPLSLLPAAGVWSWPGVEGWCWVALAGLIGTVSQLAWARALQLADVSALAPISYLQLPFVAVLAWLLFGERVDAAFVLGASLIFGATAYIAYRESRLVRER